MKQKAIVVFALNLVLFWFGAAMAANAADTAGMFTVRASTKAPDAVVQAVEAYAKEKKWQYIGANKVKNGEVTLVKVCIPEVGKLLWPLGLQVGAMLPCGNLAVYKKGTSTEISLLNAQYMNLIYPHPEVEKAGNMAQPLLTEMLDAVAK